MCHHPKYLQKSIIDMFGGLFGDEDDDTAQVATSGYSVSTPRPQCPRNSTQLSGLSNLGATCYLNALLQTLFYTPEFRDGLFRLNKEELGEVSEEAGADNSMVRLIPVQLQKLFSELLVVDQQSASVDALTSSFGWQGNEEMQQHDVQELNRILFMAVESSLVGTSGQQLISQIYHGTSVSRVICQVCGRISGREEEFLDLPIALAGCESLEDRLRDMFITMETLDGNNQYRCEACNRLVDAKRGSRLNKLPPILSFALVRFLYDFNKGERYKDTSRMSFPALLDMSPYCDRPDPRGHHQEGLLDPGLDPLEYELFSVVIHSGSTHSGHYTAYIRDIDGLGHWTHPGEDPVQIQPQVESASVDFINFDSPIALVKELLARAGGGASVNQLMASLHKQTGVSWNSRFKKSHGSIVKFLKRHDDVFEVSDMQVVSLKRQEEGKEEEGHREVRNSHPAEETDPQRQQQQQQQQQHKQEQHVDNDQASQPQQLPEQPLQLPEQLQKEQVLNSCSSVAGSQEPTVASEEKMDDESKVDQTKATKRQQQKTPPPPIGERWFECNDTHVSCMLARDIPKMYQGKKSAYMVFYRRKSLQRPLGAQGNPHFGIPLHLLSEAKRADQLLVQERIQYDLAVNTISLTVFFSQDCSLQGGALQYSPSSGLEVKIDRRQPLASLWTVVKETCPTQPCPAHYNTLHSAKSLPAGIHLYDIIGGEADAQDLTSLGLKHGNIVFVWDGTQVGGHVIRTGSSSEPIVLNISYLDGQDHKEIVQGFPQDMSLLELKTGLAQQVAVPAGNLSISLISESGSRQNAPPSVTLFGPGKNNISLRDLNLRDGEKLVAERQTKKGIKTLAHSLADKQSRGIHLVVEDRFSPPLSTAENTYPIVVVEADKNQSLADLKKTILVKIGGLLLHNEGRLRINDEYQGVGPPLHDEHTLESVGLVQGSKVIFEPGAPPTSSEIILNFQLLQPEARSFELVVDRTTSIQQCLDQLIIAGELGSDAWHLCKTNWCGEKSDILDDEESTVEQLRLSNGDLLLLEMGKLPPKGYIRLPVFLQAPDSRGHSEDQVLRSLQGTSQEPMDTSSPVSEGAGPESKLKEPPPLHEQDPAQYHPPSPGGRSQPVGTLEVSRDSTVEELKQLILTLPPLLERVVPSLAFLRVRELVGGRPGKVLRQHSQTLRRLKITANSKLCCSVLKQDEMLSQTSAVLYLQLRQPQSRRYEPAVEVVLDCQAPPTPHALRLCASRVLEIPPDHLRIAKHKFDTFQWIVISENSVPKSNKGKKPKKGSAAVNLKNSPYLLKDGDIIGVKDLREDVGDKDDFDTEEDLKGRAILEAVQEHKRQQRKAKGSDWTQATSSRQRRPEVGIKIHIPNFKKTS